MKSEKGVTLTSLIIYVIAMAIVVSIVAVITKYFYGNINKLSNTTTSLEEYTKLNAFIIEEINKTGNIIYKCGVNNEDNENYIIFYNPNDVDEANGNKGYTQYTFKENSIYLNKIKICNNIKDCKFEDVSDENNYKLKITLNIDDNEKVTTYTLKTSK
jgi:hypothetical protein